MRLPSVVVASIIVVGCAKSATNNAAPASTPAPIATLIPVATATASPDTSDARRSSTPTAVTGESAASETEPFREREEPVVDAPAPPAPCKLKATLRDAGPSANGRRVTLTLTNQGAKPLRLVEPGDGSGEGWRTPVLTWLAKDSRGKEVARAPQGRCGFMNPIEASEIFTLAPGATRDLGEWIPPPPFATGTYEVRLTYRNDPRIAARKDGASEDVKKLLAASSTCEASSNAIRVTIAN